jgi:hypothetical protein
VHSVGSVIGNTQLYVAPFNATDPKQQWKWSPGTGEMINNSISMCVVVSGRSPGDGAAMISWACGGGFPMSLAQ